MISLLIYVGVVSFCLGAIVTHFLYKIEIEQGIDLNSKCPACGHRGCTLTFAAPLMREVGEKGKQVWTEPQVMRECNTCHAKAYENCVLDPKEWVAK